MDDSLEIPNSVPKVPLGDLSPEDDEQQSSDDEDGGLDWTKLLPASARPVLPKRGEKEFEPRAGGGTNLQLHVLDRSRNAMFDTLRATRTISNKAISYATWYPDIARTHVTAARGIHFSNMGHSAPRSVLTADGVSKVQKRLELLPEEAIYLIERGSLFCWKDTDLIPRLSEVEGSPMSVQQAFAEMIGKEDLTLEKFQVYAYLKRLGYVVTRTKPPDPYYPQPLPAVVPKSSLSFLQRIKSLFSLPFSLSSLSRALFGGLNWRRPIHLSRWLHHDKSYGSLFRSLRFIPSGHGVPLTSSGEIRSNSPYRIFYNLYKPSTPFKKSAPPLPDFQIVVINARTTPMPTLQELTDLFDVLPEMPLPPPRQRRPQPQLQGASPNNPPIPAAPPAPEFQNSISSISPTLTAVPSASILRKLFPWLRPSSPSANTSSSPVAARRPNPFMVLKTGKKIIVIAAVDSGNISFFRFGQGDFTEWPMA